MTKIETCPHCGNNYGVNLDRDRLKAEVAELVGALDELVSASIGFNWDATTPEGKRERRADKQARAVLAKHAPEKEPQP